jgi:hypothetical protein
MAIAFTENFQTYTGTGFAPAPAAGQLDSDLWASTGMSDAPTAPFGATFTTGDFARGVSPAGANPVNGVNTTYTAAASPVTFNQSGVRNFCSNEDGVLRFDPGAAGSVPVTTTAACQAFTVLQ